MHFDPIAGMPAPHSLVLRMDITNLCNLDCVGCSLAEGRKKLGEPPASMKVDVFERIADEVFPYVLGVGLSCEAEPTLHPQFKRIMKIVGEKTGRCVQPQVHMVTNATMLTADRLDAIFESGLVGLAVSIDGFNPETFSTLRKNGEVDTVFAALDEIVRRKNSQGAATPHLQINYTLMKSNLHEFIPLLDYSQRWGLHNITATHVFSTPMRDMSHEFLSDWPEKSNLVLLEAETKCKEYGIIPRFPPLFRRAEPAPEPAKPGMWERFTRAVRPSPAPPAQPNRTEIFCGAPWNMLKIRWDGSVNPCDFWNYGTPLGNLQTQSFREIWLSESYTRLRAGLAAGTPTFPHCIQCEHGAKYNTDKIKQLITVG